MGEGVKKTVGDEGGRTVGDGAGRGTEDVRAGTGRT